MTMTSFQRSNGDDDGGEPPKKTIKFRNYAPKDGQLKSKKVESIKPVDVSASLSEHLEKAKPSRTSEDVDLTTLAPRKPDWDLKRDVEKKLAKLEKRTQKAIVELIRERLKDEEDLASAVNAVADR